MDCTRCEELLLEKAEGRLEPAGLSRVEGHLAACPRCRQLACLLEDEANGTLAVPVGLAEGVLARTIDRDGIACALHRLARELPELASVDVDERFTAEVMAATARAQRRRPAQRAAALWRALVQRPRFALEGAYVFGVAAFLLVGLPGAPLAAVPRNAIERLDTTISAVATEAEALAAATIAPAGRWAGARLAAAWEPVSRPALAWLRKLWPDGPVEPPPSPDNLPGARLEGGALHDRHRTTA